MSLYKVIALSVLFTLSTFNANAGIEKGDKSVSIFASLTSDDFSDTLIIFANGGYLYTDTLELQAAISLIDSGGFTSTGFGGNANLYLPGKNPDLVPYVGGGGQLLLTDTTAGSDSTIGLNGQAGFKQFLSEDVAINYQAQFLTSSNYDAFILSVGFSIFIE